MQLLLMPIAAQLHRVNNEAGRMRDMDLTGCSAATWGLDRDMIDLLAREKLKLVRTWNCLYLQEHS